MRYRHEWIFRNLYNKPIFFDCPTLWDLNRASPQYSGVPSRSKSRSPSKTATQRLVPLLHLLLPATESGSARLASHHDSAVCTAAAAVISSLVPLTGTGVPRGREGKHRRGLRRGRPAKFLAAERNARSVKDRKRSDGRTDAARREGRVKAPGHRHRRRGGVRREGAVTAHSILRQ